MFRNLLLTMIAASSAAWAMDVAKTTGNVPFPFYVGEQKLEPGTYTIGAGPSFHTVTVHNGRSPVSILAVRACSNPKTDGRPVLIFKKIDGLYFLDRVWLADGSGRQFPIGPRERELAANKHDVDIARVLISSQ